VLDNRRAGTAEVDITGVLVERGLSAAMARQALAAVKILSPAKPDRAGARRRLAAGVPIPWAEVRTVLCLSNGKSLHAELLESLGLDVTVVDLSRPQPEDGLDLNSLAGRQFDLAYQPASACHAAEPALIHAQVARLLPAGGWYHVEHRNPVRMQLAALGGGPGEYRIVRPQRPRLVAADGTVESSPLDEDPGIDCDSIQPLEALLGSLCEAGFEIVGFGERRRGDPSAPQGSESSLDAYAPPFFTVLAQRSAAGGTT
jgi:hypothetical protein